MLRDGKEISISLPEKLDLIEMIGHAPLFLEPAIPSVVDSVMPGSPAEKAGMRSGKNSVPKATAN